MTNEDNKEDKKAIQSLRQEAQYNEFIFNETNKMQDNKAAIEFNWKEKFIRFLTNDGRHRYIDKTIADVIVDYVERKILASPSPMQGIKGKEEILKECLRQQYPDRDLDSPVMQAVLRDKVITASINAMQAYHDQFDQQGISKEGWISVDADLPTVNKYDYSDRVLCCLNTGKMDVGYIMDKEWQYDAKLGTFKAFGYTVTHWMPLPAPPGASSPSSSKGEDINPETGKPYFSNLNPEKLTKHFSKEGEDKVFTLKEALDIWEAGSQFGLDPFDTATKQQHFSEKFGITIN